MIDSSRRVFLAGLGGMTAAGAIVPWQALEAKMIEPTSTSEHLMYCTVRIVGVNANGSEIKTGTGFFYDVPFRPGDDRQVPILVTNKHVIANVQNIDFLIHTNSSDAKKPDGNVRIRSAFTDWIHHPNPNVDLCALPIGGVMTQAKGFFRSLGPPIVPNDEQLEQLTAVEEVLMVGYPNGLWDAKNNYPLMRRGITSTHPAVDFDVAGVSTTVVDMACFPGSSGSPVLIHNHGSYANKMGGVNIGNRLIFLGILFSGPVMQSDGKIVIREIPTATEQVAQVAVMMNLGYIVKAKEMIPLGAAVLAKIGPVQ